MTDTPASLGFRAPAEWAPHEAVWIGWPHQKEDWPGKFGAIRWVYVEIVRLLTRTEIVGVLVNDKQGLRRAADCLDQGGVDLSRVRFVRARTDRGWTRDSGPSFVVDDAGEVALVDWKFNGWAKYDDFHHDDRIPRRLAAELGLRRWKPTVEIEGESRRVVLEGGSIDVNGLGTLLTTEECLLSKVQERNPGLGREGTERVLADYLGVHKVVWLNRGIVGDDTHGHVDDVARFVGPSTVVAAVEPDEADPNHAPLQENWEILKAARDQDDKPLEVVALPMPAPVVFRGQRLPASYANFFIANGLVLVPTFNDPADREAMKVLEAQFHDRTVVGVHAVDLVWGLGTLHCMTREQPKGPPLPRE